MNVTPINKRSGFKILIALDNYSGEDFRLSFYTAGTVQKRFVCSYINGTYTNCQRIDDYHVLCSFPSNAFNLGILKCEVCYVFYDELSESNYFKIISNEIVTARVNDEDSHIEITNDKTGKIVTPEFAIYLLGPVLQPKSVKIKLNGVVYEATDGIIDLGMVESLPRTVQVDWDENAPTSLSYIKHKPDLTIYATKIELQAVEEEIPEIPSGIVTDENYVHTDNNFTDTDKAKVGSAITEETDPTVPSWAKQPSKPAYTAQEVGALPADTPIPTKTSDLTNDSGFLTEHQDISGKVDKIAGKGLSSNDYTDTEKTKLAGLDNYDDTEVRNLIGGKQDMISDLASIRSGAGAGATAVQPSALGGYYTKTEVNELVADNSIAVETKNSASTLTISADKLTVISGAVGTSAITLQVPNDNKAHVWDIIMATDSSVAITFAMSNGATILKPSGFSVAASKDVEISVIGVGNKYYLRYGEFAS